MPSILNSDDGVVSGTSGLKTTGGNDGALNIQTNGSNAISISSGQRSTFPTTIGVGGATPSTSGSGISFPATQSASSDANTLDDYEQGTFTATITPATSGTITLNASYNELSYTKIGRVVTVTGELLVSSVSSPVGTSASINNLPFAAANLTDSSGTAGFGITLFTGAAWSVSPARISESATTVTWQIDASTIAANYNLFISFSYISAD